RRDARQQFALLGRLDHVIVGACREAFDDVGFLAARGEENHRQPGIRRLPDPGKHVQPLGVGQAAVQQHQIDGFVAEPPPEVIGGAEHGTAVAGLFQPQSQQRRLVGIVLDTADRPRHSTHCCLRALNCMVPSRCCRTSDAPFMPNRPAGCQSTSKLMRMFTRHSLMPPSLSVATLMSLIQAPRIFLTVLPAFSSPCRTASSMPLEEDALNSMTLVTDMLFSLAGCGIPMIRVYG